MSTSAQESPATPAPVAAEVEPVPPIPAAEPAPATGLPCARCGAVLPPGQDWCLECGAAAHTRVAGAHGWRLPLVLAGVIALLAGAAAAVWLVSLSDDATSKASTLTTAAAVAPVPAPPTAASVAAAPPVARTTTVTKTKTVTRPGRTVTAPAVTVTAPGRTVTVTTPAATTPTPASASIPGWPSGTTGYTVILLSAGKTTAYAKARKLQKAGTSVGVIDTTKFSASNAGARYVVFSGRYPTRTAARAGLTKLSRAEPSAYVGFVKPR